MWLLFSGMFDVIVAVGPKGRNRRLIQLGSWWDPGVCACIPGSDCMCIPGMCGICDTVAPVVYCLQYKCGKLSLHLPRNLTLSLLVYILLTTLVSEWDIPGKGTAHRGWDPPLC